jgi:hypothetical protein
MQDVRASDLPDVKTSDRENVEASAAKLREAGQRNIEHALEARRLSEEAFDDASKPDAHATNTGAQKAWWSARFDGATLRRWPGWVSIVALMFSGISLYVTVLKPAALSIDVGIVGHVSWDKATKAEMIALPLTVTNEGAHDAVVLGLKLGPDDAPDRYRSSFVGGQSAGQNEPFAPWAVAGHGWHSGDVQFHSKGDAKALIAPTGSAPVKSYELCLTVQVAASRPFGFLDWLLERRPTAVRLVVEPAQRFSESDLENGKWIPLRIDDQRSVRTGACRIG